MQPFAMKRSLSTAQPSFLGQPSRKVLATGLLLILAVLVGTAGLMWQEFGRTKARDQRHLELLVSAMEAHASHTFDNARLSPARAEPVDPSVETLAT